MQRSSTQSGDDNHNDDEAEKKVAINLKIYKMATKWMEWYVLKCKNVTQNEVEGTKLFRTLNSVSSSNFRLVNARTAFDSPCHLFIFTF